MSESPQTLIIGAGVAGMTCANKLASAGQRVTVVDKGNRPGGRLSTRQSRTGVQFDHGAQYFTAKSVTFQQQVSAWQEAGIAHEWTGRIVDLKQGQAVDTQRQAKRFVGTPGMAAVVQSMCNAGEGVDGPYFDTRVEGLEKQDAGWAAVDATGRNLTGFNRVILATPATQANQILSASCPDLAAEIGEATMSACWSLMLAFATPVGTDFDGAFVEDSPLSWIAKDSAKPGRDAVAAGVETWVLHASSSWSNTNVEATHDFVSANLVAAFTAALGRPIPAPRYASAHRWRYAHVTEPLRSRWLFDEDQQVGVCGDACSDGAMANIERAYLSGLALAEHLLAV